MSSRGRGRGKTSVRGGKAVAGGKRKRSLKLKDEEILSESSEEEAPSPKRAAEDNAPPEDEFADETPDERRLRIARNFVNLLKEEDPGDAETTDKINFQLRSAALAAEGRLFVPVATRWQSAADSLSPHIMRAPRAPVTSVAVDDSGLFAYTGAKDCQVVRWDLTTGARLVMGSRADANIALGPDANGKDPVSVTHTDQVLAVALHSSGELLASGGRDRRVRLWNTKTGGLVHVFETVHRDAITSLAFRKNSNQFYSASLDRTVVVWDCGDQMYLETLYGHMTSCQCVDALARERALTCGGDRTVRLWKIPEETHLLFHSPITSVSLDCAALLNEDSWVVGGQDGCLSVWTSMKKKVVAQELAHPAGWVTSVATVRFSDLCASGASDGSIRLWNCGAENARCLRPVASLRVDGWINSMGFNASGTVLVAAVGQDHRLGRWTHFPRARNGLAIFRLR
eukprot:gnl/Spiro4/5100_TR2548_c0_g1_i1.p1 gnl/Spiro4/5100_TR2548_c0_g1~~gnl/Spiro4/5100_TR2548_c0_g1_i1.p1  ORF type:complete len:456 (-),score=74.07 gnl/Spiro4/5100_TR2548_c0_g1_i1:72-1439(-)